MRSSTVNSPALPGFTRTATTSSSYRAAARLTTSTWPFVTGSNDPGQTARLTDSDRTGARPRRSGGRAGRAEIGRGSGRGRVEISVVAGSLKKKKNIKLTSCNQYYDIRRHDAV